jgi:predicted Holliday junction resolvase-like endonuclease
MAFGIQVNDKTMKEILKTLDRIVDNHDELEHWTMAIETTAISMNKNKIGKIAFEYFPDEKVIKFYVKDAKSRDNLLKSVEIHLPLMPESLQGFFSVFKYNLKNVKFNT